MFQRDILSWWTRPPFLRAWGRKSDTLFAGPWLGEFGWELMNWQAFLRWLSPSYRRMIVCCRPGTEALYEDFADEFTHHAVKGTADCDWMTTIDNPGELTRALSEAPAEANVLSRVGWQPDRRKRFVRYGRAGAAQEVDVLFHPRGRGHGDDRNWRAQKWETLLASLANKKLSVGCIGLTGATLEVTGEFEDFRDLPLRRSMDLIANARLVIGPSSGPMHLASLCRTPHVVWTDAQKWARGRTNRTKYETWWNPFSTPVHVIDEEGFDPDPNTVLTATLGALQRGR